MFIYSNLAISLDGKIDTAVRKAFILGSKNDHKRMKQLRKKSDAILFGGSTLRSHPYAVPGTWNIIVSASLNGISSKMKFFKDSKIKRILFVGPKAPKQKLKTLSKSCEIFILRGNLAPQIVQILSKKKIRRLLIEGGGEVMWLFSKNRLIKEFNVTLTPRILGGRNAPTLVDGDGFTPSKSLKLKMKSFRRIGNELFLTYLQAPA